MDYVPALARWVHLLAGVMWVGLLYYFNFVQVPGLKDAAADGTAKPAASTPAAVAAEALTRSRRPRLLSLLEEDGDIIDSLIGRTAPLGRRTHEIEDEREIGAIFAVEKPGHMDGRATFSVQFFDRTGASALKVFLNFGEPISPERRGAFSHSAYSMYSLPR